MAKTTFGDTGASSLLRAATAAMNRTNTYNDAMAGYEWDQSLKDQAAWDKYKGYLDKRVSDIQNSDPAKALELTKAQSSAGRSFNSAEIARATQQVQYGNMSNRDKYALMQHLKDKAMAQGDYDNAQKIDEQQSSLSITIQNEEKAAANAATSASNKAQTAQVKAYTDQIAAQKGGIDALNNLRNTGKITPAEYQNQLAQFYQGSVDPKTGKQVPGIAPLTKALSDYEVATNQANGTSNQTYQNEYAKLAADPNTAKYLNGTVQSKIGIDNSQEMRFNQNTGSYEFTPRAANEVTGHAPITDAKGNPVIVNGHQLQDNLYANPQAFTDSSGNINGFQYVSNVKDGHLASGTGAGVLMHNQKSEISYNDPSGVGYTYIPGKDGKPTKKFIGYETKTDANGNTYNQAVYANKSQDIKNMPGVKYGAGSKLTGATPDFSPSTNAKPIGTAKNSFESTAGISRLALNAGNSIGNTLSNLFSRNNQALAVQRVQSLAAAKVANDAAAAEFKRQQQLLPVFRAPAYLPPPPAPKPIAPHVPAPNFAPLPGQPGYVNGVNRAQAVMGNPKSTPFQAIEALRGGINAGGL